MKKLLTFILMCTTLIGFAQKKTYDIGILYDTYNPAFANEIYLRLQKEIKAVVGEDAKIVFNKKNILANDYNLKKAKENYEKLLNTSDIILVFGNLNTSLLQQQKSFPKPVIAIADSPAKKTENITKTTTSEIDNLLYLTYSEDILSRLKTFQNLTDFKKVGIVVEKNIADVLDYENLIKEKLKGTGFQYKIITYSTLNDIIHQLDDIDALDLEKSFSLTQAEIQKLSQILIEKKVTSFSASRRSDVQNGILATNISDDDLSRFLRRIALSIESYISGTNFSQQPVLIDFNSALVINQTTAMALNLPMNYKMLSNVEFVDNPKVNPNAKKVYDLPTLIAEILHKNLSLQSEQKETEISQQNIKTAKSTYLPELTANANGAYLDPKVAELSQGRNPEFTTSGNITLQQVLFSAEANANIKIQKNLVKAQQEKLNTQQLDMIFNATNAYFNVLILKANAKIQFNNLALTKRNLQIAEENYNAGQSGKTDLLRFRSQKAQNTQAVIEAVNMLKQGYNAINQLTNQDLNEPIDVKETDLDDDIFKNYNYAHFMEWINMPSARENITEFLVQEALNNSPEIKQLAYNMKAIENQVDLYGKSRFLPQIALQGQYNYQFSKSGKGSVLPQGYPASPNGNYNVGINVSIPIFSRNTNNINQQKALLQKEQLEINEENFEMAISANIHNTILDLINQINNIELSKVSEESAQEALDLTQNAYSNGAVTIVQLIDAQNNYIKTQQAKINATYNYLIKMLQLERYMGNYFLLNTPEENQAFNQRFLEFENNKINNK